MSLLTLSALCGVCVHVHVDRPNCVLGSFSQPPRHGRVSLPRRTIYVSFGLWKSLGWDAHRNSGCG